ncbi:MAG: preprotein translocase subunit Sec61beta [Candidatus Bathyarchaeota archaeon]|nr:preprotein translocase subunit Sec61beta [Candidatus Bathyarchaeota archaeon]
MSSRRERRRRRVAPAPASGAGLLRFFEEESLGVKIGPRTLIILTIAFIIICVLIQFSI